MPKRIVLYPFLLALYIVLNPLINNLGEIPLSQALRPLIVLLLAAVLSMLILRWIVRDWHYAGYLTFLVLAFFFLYGHISRMLQDRFSLNVDAIRPALLAGWGGLFLALGMNQIWHRIGGAQVTRALNIYLGLLLFVGVLSGASALFKSIAQPSERDQPQPSFEGAVQLDCTSTPDIYFIILDAYGRADVLESMYGVDNSAFIARLENKGFYVASQSHSNYIQSIFSIPSGLNFSYLESEPAGAPAAEYFTGLIADNQLMRTLKPCGYQTIAFETGFSFSDRPQVDLYLSSGSPLNNFEDLLLADSPLDWLPQALYQKPPAYSYEGHRERVLFTFEELAAIPERPGPKLVFAHIISPHPPFVFDAQGNAIQPPRSYSIGDGDDYRGDWEEYRQGYTGQVQFVNRMLEKTIDAILSKSSTPPVIIIQGDHGPGGFLDWDSPEQTCLWERASIFNAYYLPGTEVNALSPDISPVNSFRIVLKTYFDANLELLPDRTYFTSHRLTRQIIDITGQRDSTLNCP
jgi:hypothetical protein